MDMVNYPWRACAARNTVVVWSDPSVVDRSSFGLLVPRACMRSRGRVFGLSVSLFVSLSTTFWPIQAF